MAYELPAVMPDSNDFTAGSDGFFEKKSCVLNVHLISGEDIIGDTTDHSDYLTIKKPTTHNIGFDPGNSKFRVGLLPLRPYLGDTPEIDIPWRQIIFVTPVNDQMEKMYRQFTSDITLATQMPTGQVLLG